MSSAVAVPDQLATPAFATPALPPALDAGAEQRWQAWRAHGLASERAFNRRMKGVAAVVVPLAAAALAAFLMLS